MAGFMNAELVAIRDALVCGCCGTVFKGSDSQARKVKYEKLTVYCSKFCRAKGQGDKLRLSVPKVGNCKHCGKEVYSRNPDKQYCDSVCYQASDQLKATAQQNIANIAKQNPVKKAIRELNAVVGRVILTGDQTLIGLRAKGTDQLTAEAYSPAGAVCNCLECGKAMYAKPSDPRQFCGQKCYRAHKAKRFERWAANPQPLVEITDYEAFLNRDILTCIVQGCCWEGKHLSLHVNQTHGIPAEAFKALFGFNKTAGVIGKSLAERYSQRELQGIARYPDSSGLEKAQQTPRSPESYRRTRQALENAQRSHQCIDESTRPIRVCQGCGQSFVQSTVFGRAKYCTVDCRTQSYASEKKRAAKRPIRNKDGTFRWVAN